MHVFSFSSHKFDVRRNEPPSDYYTILRAIEVADPTVFNTLVDQVNIESILLIESDDDARSLMYNVGCSCCIFSRVVLYVLLLASTERAPSCHIHLLGSVSKGAGPAISLLRQS